VIHVSFMKWDDLRIIAAVRENGTFAGASKDLRIDETTVARRLARIQGSLGLTLFDAIDGVRKPTPQCSAILAHIDEISRRIAEINAIGDRIDGPTGTIRVTSTPSIAEHFLAPHVAEFLGLNPGLSLELKTSNENVNFSRWEADLAIRLGKPAQGAFVIRKLGELRLYLFRPAETTEQSPDHIVCAYPEELADTPEMRQLTAAGLTGRVRLRTSNTRIIRTIIQSRTGIGILPEHSAHGLFNDPQFIVTPLQSRREVWLLIQPHLQNEPAARLAIDWITDRLAAGKYG